nr:MAG TPA: putative replisome organizer protein [Caudoviricetes sp.]
MHAACLEVPKLFQEGWGVSNFLQLVDRPIAFQRSFVRLGVGITGALLLSQIVYWQNRMEGQWFYKTQTDLEEETGLTRYEQEGARKKLVSCGVLEEAKRGIPAKLYFRVNQERLEELLIGETQHAGVGKTNKQGCGNSANSDAENQHAGVGKTNEQSCGNSASIHTVDYQETTQKINTENKSLGASAEADTPKVKSSTDYSPAFEEAWQAYPKRSGGNNKLSAFKAWNARIKQGVKPEMMLEGVKRYAAFMASEGKIGTSFVKQAATFFGPDKHFDEAWLVETTANKASARQDQSRYEWYAKSDDGSAEVFINQSAIDRMNRGGYRP